METVLNIRNSPVPRPLVPGGLAVRIDLLRWPEKFYRPWTSFNFIDGAIEMADFAVFREDLIVEEIKYSALHRSAYAIMERSKYVWLAKR